MADPYDSLIETGYIGSLKRDILLSAADDIEYLCHIRRDFDEASAAACEESPACTARVTQELISNGFCTLATWGKGDEEYEVLEKTSAELRTIAEHYTGYDSTCFDYFLIATQRGKEWVARYKKLVSEL